MLKTWQKIICGSIILMACWEIADFSFVSKQECAICSHAYSHAPALLNISTGRIDTLDVYDYSVYDPTVPAEYQRGGYASILPLGDGFAMRMTDPWIIEAKLPNQPAKAARGQYCSNCRSQLRDSASSYTILDLITPGEPVIHPLEAGAAFSFRCYDIQMEGEKLTVTGTLELPEDNKGYNGYPPY